MVEDYTQTNSSIAASIDKINAEYAEIVNSVTFVLEKGKDIYVDFFYVPMHKVTIKYLSDPDRIEIREKEFVEGEEGQCVNLPGIPLKIKNYIYDHTECDKMIDENTVGPITEDMVVIRWYIYYEEDPEDKKNRIYDVVLYSNDRSEKGWYDIEDRKASEEYLVESAVPTSEDLYTIMISF